MPRESKKKAPTRKTEKRIAGGLPSSDLIFSAQVGSNADLFPSVLRLHVPKGSSVADVTFGKGTFWKKVPEGDYELLASDLSAKPSGGELWPIRVSDGVDLRDLPYDDESIDCVVLDPPYMEGLYRNTADHLAGGGAPTAPFERPTLMG